VFEIGKKSSLSIFGQQKQLMIY